MDATLLDLVVGSSTRASHLFRHAEKPKTRVLIGAADYRAIRDSSRVDPSNPS